MCMRVCARVSLIRHRNSPFFESLFPPVCYSELIMGISFEFFQVYMECKGRSVDVSLANCTGKRVSLADFECDPSAASCLCIIVLSCSFLDKSNDILWKPRLRETNFF
jgi:hypothetical protein